MTGNKNSFPVVTLATAAAFLICALVAAVFLFSNGNGLKSVTDFGAVTPSALSGGDAYSGAPLTQTYKNNTFRFSVSMPEDFTSAVLPDDGSGASTVLFQNKTGDGIQVLITPYPDDTKVLTADDIQNQIPDMKISEPQDVTIGPEYKGVAFLSDNSAFDGASREVWFVYKGNLYQISTYARLDSLLKALFATWKFF